MDLLERIISCSSDSEADEIITETIRICDLNATKVEQLGFLDYGKTNYLFETYGMETTDFFYEFTHFIRKYNINNMGALVHYLEFFINNYFGLPGKNNRQEIFNDIAWKSSATDDEYFEALDNNKLGDLKGLGAAMCTERSALAEQILSIFGFETYYCIGSVNCGNIKEGHCFNIVKRVNDYALLDYSLPVTSYKQDGSVNNYFPFVGEMTNEEFEDFINTGSLKKFDNYEFINVSKKNIINPERFYVVGSSKIDKDTINLFKK